MCERELRLCNQENQTTVDLNKELFYITNNKSEAAKSNNFVNNLYAQMKVERANLVKVVLMSDLHVDYSYTPGAKIECGKPLCCRTDSGMAQAGERAAGIWGDYGCDLSPTLLTSMLQYINQEIKPSAVLWGGDSVPHNLDSLTQREVVSIMQKVTS